jgi:hypothetical protein
MERGIKTRDTGGIKSSLFYEFWNKQYYIFERLSFFIDAGWKTERLDEAITEMETIINDANDELKEFWERYKSEKKKGGVKVIDGGKKLDDQPPFAPQNPS